MKNYPWSFILLMLLMTPGAFADVSLPRILGSRMVLQRERPLNIWGWADPGERVTVQFAGQGQQTEADACGQWRVVLEPMEASAEPRKMTISGANEIVLEDVLVGEVWLASGQSNMEWPIRRVVAEEKQVVEAEKDNPLLRAFHVNRNLQAAVPMQDTLGVWMTCQEMAARQQPSAVGFFFARRLQRELGVPVAFIDSTWGGQRIERFLPDRDDPVFGEAPTAAAPMHPEWIQNAEADREALRRVIREMEKGIHRPLQLRFHGFGNDRNGIYNAMIAPLTPFSIRGVIWYQGEANRKSTDYFEKLRMLAEGWSRVFRVPDLPLYQVQIAPSRYEGGMHSVLCNNIWAAQYRAAEEIERVEVVPIHDTDIPVQDIHPPKKKTVGERLAAVALKHQYGRDVVATGPRVERAVRRGDQVVVSFRDVAEGLTTSDGQAPIWFEVSEDGQRFVSATEAVIEDDSVVLTVTGTPAYVRMGWVETAIPNLMDKTGWPVFAFCE